VAGVIFVVGVANPPTAAGAAKPPAQGQVTIIKRR
jgi:hypothetical protein